ncbi:MFS transporter [Glycomyces endophyticus]|uniref:MFS transporter n=1 Tax=Glycomyces endophyticus TaxID=480996 RepID=A0ABN2H3Q1_9ACTN
MTAPPGPASDRLRDNPDFRSLFTAAVAAKLGTYLSYIAVPLLAIEVLGATAGEVGALAALATAAALLLGLPAGAWIDRADKRRLMVAADLARAALLLSVPVAWWFDMLTVWQLYAVVFLAGVGTTAFDIAQQSVLPAIVDRSHLTGANARLVALDSALGIGGNGAAGFLVSLVGAPVAILADAAGYLWSAMFVARIRTAPAPAAPRRPLLGEIGEGLGHVLRHPALRPLVLAGALNNCSIQMFLTMLPLVWIGAGLPAYGLGLHLAAGAVGILAGATAARRLRSRLGAGRALWTLGAAAAPAALCLPLVGPGWGAWASGAAWAFTGSVIGMANVIGVSLRQQLTPDPLLGRMNAVFRFLLMGAVALGATAAAVIGELASPQAAMWCGAVGMALQWTILFASRSRIV